MKPESRVDKIEKIKKATGLEIDSVKFKHGGESEIVEVNGQWIFRFPKSSIIAEKTKKRWNFLKSFSASIQVPKPEYITNQLIGYKKILGEPLLRTQIEKLSDINKSKIAKQLGLFLKTLHSHKDKHINFDTGYLIMRRTDYKANPKEFTKYLNIRERKALETRIKKIAQNPSNFKNPTTIIHGDFNSNNILWDKKQKIITGILDWSDMGLGIPAMDFISVAEFNGKKTTHF